MKKTFLSSILLFITAILFATTIYDIQYTTTPGPDNTYPSPFDGQTVTVEGIVTAIGFSGYNDNFFISMPEGGAWKGVLVYMAGDTTIVVGDEVEIIGTVEEYYGLTEISGYSLPITVTLLSSGNPVPDPVVVTCADLQPEGVGEPYESVLIELHDVVVVEEQSNYGEWDVTDGTGIAQIDDGFFYLENVQPPIVITIGMEWAIIRGILDYSYDEYGLNPRTPDDLIEPGGLNADFTADPLTGLAPLQVQFTDASSGNITIWEWDFDNDGIIDSYIQNPIHTYSETGVYTVSLTVGDGVNEDTEIKEDYIIVIEELDANFEADVTFGDAPLEVQFTDLSIGNIIEWSWDFDNDGTIDSNLQNPIHIYAESGIYTISLTVGNGTNEDTEIKEDYITVLEPLDADFEADVTLGEAPLEVQFTDLSTGDVIGWMWDFDNDGTIDSNEQNPIYIYEEVGVYTVSLTVTDGTDEDAEVKEDYIEVTGTGTEHEIIPVETMLFQNHPNPFNPITNIQFDIKENETGVLSIFNLKGQIIISQRFNSGKHDYLWNAENYSSGVYLYKLQTESFTEIRKMLLLK